MARDPFVLSDEDRLPWLEPVDEVVDERTGLSRGAILAALILVLVGLAAIGGIYWWKNRELTPSGSGELIVAPKEPYRVRPIDEGGMKVEGQGDVAFKTSEGAQVQGSLDLRQLPETPVAKASPTPRATAAGGASAVIGESKGVAVAKAPAAAIEAEGGPGSVVQLGAFPTEAAANKAWDAMTKRIAYVSALSKIVIRADVNGRTYYRLRSATGSPAEARQLCAKLTLAGEHCLVVN